MVGPAKGPLSVVRGDKMRRDVWNDFGNDKGWKIGCIQSIDDASQSVSNRFINFNRERWVRRNASEPRNNKFVDDLMKEGFERVCKIGR